MSRWICSNRAILPMFANLSGVTSYTSDAQIIMEFEGETPIAGALYDNYNGKSVHVHVWVAKGQRPSRVWWWVAHDYPFNRLAVTNVFATIASSNEDAIRLAEKMGGKVVATLPDYFLTCDDCLMFLGTEETATHWQRYRNGKVSPPTYSRIAKAA